MRSLVLLVPGSLDTRTGGYGYDRHIVHGLRDRGWHVDVRELRDEFPAPTAAARDDAVRALAAIPDDTLILIDGLALGALPNEVERESLRLRIVGLVHHPLANETGLAADVVARLEASERRALAAVRAVVVTSRTTAGALRLYGVDPDRITVVEPGTDFGPPARGSRPRPPASSPDSRELALLCVATLTPRKGHDILFRALASLRHFRWRLICAGSLDRDPATVARLRAQLQADGLADRVELAGDLDSRALNAHYAAADLFVLPTLYEGYGMAVAEALARGLPVVSTATGAIDYLVAGGFGRPSDRPAGIVVPPGDQDAFTQALARVVGDADLRARMADGARLARARLPRWPHACEAMERVLERAGGASR
jgi:glycosyltransferase involved in cell wall biosynthesis